MSTPTQRAKQSPLLDVPSACEYLGGIHKATLYRLIGEHKIRPVRVTRGRTMFALADLDAHIAASKDRKHTRKAA